MFSTRRCYKHPSGEIFEIDIYSLSVRSCKRGSLCPCQRTCACPFGGPGETKAAYTAVAAIAAALLSSVAVLVALPATVFIWDAPR